MFHLGDIVIYELPAALALLGLALAFAAWCAFHARRRLWRVPGLLAAMLAPWLMAATYTGLPIAPTNAVMALYPSWQYLAVLRLGVNTIGDAPPQWFVPSAISCAIVGGDVGSEVATADGGCFNASFSAGGADAREWGVKADGASDSTNALQAGLNYVASHGMLLRLPPGVSLFNSQLLVGGSTGLTEPAWGISGAGQNASWLVYAGASTTIDLIKIGNVLNPSNAFASAWSGLRLENFGVDSNTKMTAGAALHVIDATGAQWYNLQAGRNPQNGPTQNLWNGFYFDSGNSTWLTGFEVAAQNDALDVSGLNNSGSEYTGPSFTQGLILHATTGIHIGGGVGGAYFDFVDVLENGQNVVIDNALSSANNDQVFFGPGSELDVTTTGDDVLINTTAGAGPQYIFNGWIATANTNGIEIEKCNPGPGGSNCEIFIGGSAELLNFKKSAILIDSGATGIGTLDVDGTIIAYGTDGGGEAAIQCNASPGQIIMRSMPTGYGIGSGASPMAGCSASYSLTADHVIGYSPGTVPAVSACGTSPVLQAGSNDRRGQITTGTGTVSSCTLTFGHSFVTGPGNLPVCTAALGGTFGTAVSLGAVSAGAITFNFSTALSSPNQLYYQCDD